MNIQCFLHKNTINLSLKSWKISNYLKWLLTNKLGQLLVDPSIAAQLPGSASILFYVSQILFQFMTYWIFVVSTQPVQSKLIYLILSAIKLLESTDKISANNIIIILWKYFHVSQLIFIWWRALQKKHVPLTFLVICLWWTIRPSRLLKVAKWDPTNPRPVGLFHPRCNTRQRALEEWLLIKSSLISNIKTELNAEKNR